MAGLNKRRASAQLEQAGLHLERGEWSTVASLVQPVLDAGIDTPAAFMMLGEAQRQLNQGDEALATFERGLAKHPGDAMLEGRVGAVLLDRGEAARAAEFLSRASKKLPRDSQVLTTYAGALLALGRAEDAEAQLTRALLVGGGDDTRLVLAITKLRRGQHAEADKLAAQVESATSGTPMLHWSARMLRADLAVLRGDAAEGLRIWREADLAGYLGAHQLARMAHAAALAGERAIADDAIERRLAQEPTAEDLLLFAELYNLRGEPQKALDAIARAEPLARPNDESAWRFELLSTRGRTLRLLGRRDEARAALTAALAMPEAQLPHIGAAPNVDLGHIAMEEGDFEAAQAAFRTALERDAEEPEARRALELIDKRLQWRQTVESTASERVGAAQAEAEAMRRRYLVRENEVERLKREVKRLELERADAQAQAAKVQRETSARVRAELEAREKDVEGKAEENLRAVLSPDRCPERLWNMLRVAERTYQQALYTELPTAAVAVLFSGAFERSLIELFVQPFGAWLDEKALRAKFLEQGVRERRGSRVEYFDRFTESFDREFDARPPSMGEVARVLDRRQEKYLQVFQQFLTERYDVPDSFWAAFSSFVTWAKESLRDPVAHGHLELDWAGFKQFREQLLFEFDGAKPGALPRLLLARRP
ncbi:MAG: hypothetical protein DI536_11320 [Archangium gephyra]|uniref:Tetratricopeptide repeat protein n=1 Tax=Archangium gephyra TaxID=48 RepID=A0A2W5TKT4_9BACT|nr:MAG: hypothetical protein DI536_11320 [Archangium gephyra]